jgi:hypothetical protein
MDYSGFELSGPGAKRKLLEITAGLSLEYLSNPLEHWGLLSINTGIREDKKDCKQASNPTAIL